jgi:hypothetical protein
MEQSERGDQPSNVRIELYTAYLEDLGRIGGRHENARKFYISVISALFVFLSMAGKDGPFVNVQGKVLLVVAVVGIFVCVAWFDHMGSFGKLYFAKLETLRVMETEVGSLKPFTIETELLRRPARKQQGAKPRFRYRPLTLVDKVIPAASVLLFIGLLVFKFR